MDTEKLKKYSGLRPWKPGQSGNPHGRPRVPEAELLRQAVAETEIEKKKSLWKHLVERAYQDDAVLIALSKKFLPDKLSADIDVKENFEGRRSEMLSALREIFGVVK